ncbi:hypothetical protein TNCT_247721 [Trichonephila clavata]|uniref:Uncharacterized protein n=1 Tax=Trichonephila clavata TaxID=2740835 RepID=A0A8X6FTM9_TRICU|nr:hypothetical protein TNCT_247721 [Trichonephila clavata]
MEENFETRLVHSKKLESESFKRQIRRSCRFSLFSSKFKSILEIRVLGVWPGGTVFQPYGTPHHQQQRLQRVCALHPLDAMSAAFICDGT